MIDKTPLKSKKFIAYLIADIGWKIILFFMIVRQSSKLDHYTFLLLITLVIVSGFIQVGYILGQAALDKYTKVTEHLTQTTKESEKK